MTKKMLLALGLLIADPALADSAFQGFYAGAYAGVVHAKDAGREYLVDAQQVIPTGFQQDTSPYSGSYGLELGYNKVFLNNVLIGLVVDAERRGGGEKAFQLNPDSPGADYGVSTKMKNAFSIRTRAGYVVNEGRTLGYVSAGYGVAHIQREYFDFTDQSSTKSLIAQSWHGGWLLGAGAEQFVTDKLALKVDYLYTHYGKETISTDALWGDQIHENQKWREHAVRIGLDYHF